MLLKLILAVMACATGSTTAPATQPARIVYCCQLSGGMAPKIDALKLEVQRAVDGLQPKQRFNIIGFHETDAELVKLSGVPIEATSANQEKVQKFLGSKFTTSGGSDPVGAMKECFKVRPDVIWFLGSAANYSSTTEALKAITNLNPLKHTKINTTTAFVLGHDAEAMHFLYELAKQNGGVCVDATGKPYVDPSDAAAASHPPRDNKPSIFQQ